MIVDELTALLYLGKLNVRHCSFFTSIAYKVDTNNYREDRKNIFHVYLKNTGFLLPSWMIVDAGTEEVLYEGKRCKELLNDIKKYEKMSSTEKAEKTRQAIHKALSGHFEKIIKEHNK